MKMFLLIALLATAVYLGCGGWAMDWKAEASSGVSTLSVDPGFDTYMADPGDGRKTGETWYLIEWCDGGHLCRWKCSTTGCVWDGYAA